MHTPGLPDRVLAALVCPVCGDDLAAEGRVVRCPRRHAYDVARQGYLNLLPTRAGTADTAAMVADRAAFLDAGHYAPLADLVAELAPTGDGLVVETGAGTAYHLGAVLTQRPDTVGLALDASVPAARRAARSHDRLGAVVWDVWRPWPVRDGAAAVVLDVFAPRNGPEFHRVLAPGGLLLVVTPGEDHLAELGRSAGLLDIDPDKARRLATTVGERFEQVVTERMTYAMTLDPADAAHVVGMGPAGHHDRPDSDSDDSDERREVTASFVVSLYRAR